MFTHSNKSRTKLALKYDCSTYLIPTLEISFSLHLISIILL